MTLPARSSQPAPVLALKSDIALTPGQVALHTAVGDFIERELVPRVADMESKGTHADTGLPRLMGELGWLGVFVDREYGGLDLGHVSRALVCAALGYANGAAAAIYQASLIPTFAIRHLGRDEQRREWLERICAGLWATIAVTEPDGGSDILAIETTARRQADGSYRLDGRKCFTGNSGIAGVHLIVARTSAPEDRSPHALSAFLVDAGQPGLTVTQPRLVGLHGFTLGELELRDVRVPADRLLGHEGDGFAAATGASVVCGRLNLAAVMLGLHHRLRDDTVAFLTARARKGARLADHPVVSHHLADMESRLMSAESSVLDAARLLDHAKACDTQLFHTKLHSSQMASANTQLAEALFGGYAILADSPLARTARDIRHTHAPAGPDDIQRHRIGESVRGVHRGSWSGRFARLTPHCAPAA
ncbi:acyl-CoA dehydrogenase family protein [Streptomyces sp. NPDC053474]|uniref:acyl-CoA dehydrogenase family protein n=1 Tax=Streptomyces sp. NPDC053474 TaxID=3365704 RepID=UPI0037D4D9B1